MNRSEGWKWRRLRSGGWVLALILTAAAWRGNAGEAEDQFNFATGLLIKKEYDLAAEEFAGLLKKFPAFSQADLALYRLGEARWNAKHYKGASAAFLKLLASHPRSEKLPQACFRLGQITSRTDHARASTYYAQIPHRWPKHELAEAASYWAAEELLADGRGKLVAVEHDKQFPKEDHLPRDGCKPDKHECDSEMCFHITEYIRGCGGAVQWGEEGRVA